MAARVESRGRSRALQALYAWDLRGQPELERTADRIWDDLAIAADERAFARRLLSVVAASRDALDAELIAVTHNWRLDRIGAIERCVLRLGAAELSARITPPRVVLQECVRLAERYGSEQSAKFVNGVLDAVARQMGVL